MEEKKPKSYLIAYLCFIFGLFGIHRIYLEKYVSGIFLLVSSSSFCIFYYIAPSINQNINIRLEFYSFTINSPVNILIPKLFCYADFFLIPLMVFLYNSRLKKEITENKENENNL